MKFQFETLIPNDKVKTIIETYENEGWALRFPHYTNEKEEWESWELIITMAFQKGNERVCIQFPKVWFEGKEKEPLEVGVWYNREEFDGNPNGYGLIEEDEDGEFTTWSDKEDTESLLLYTTRFMYFELPEKEES